MDLPGLLQQYKSFLQTFVQSSEAHVIPLDQKMEDVFSMFPFYKTKTIMSFHQYVKNTRQSSTPHMTEHDYHVKSLQRLF